MAGLWHRRLDLAVCGRRATKCVNSADGNVRPSPFVARCVAADAIPFGSGRWTWDGAQPVAAHHLGRDCLLVENGTVGNLERTDGTIELELAVGSERAFPGVVWRLQDDQNFESFFVRPHQIGNPDAIQYTPVLNGISSWQLYHGEGFWAPVAFPIDEWFTIRVVFAGPRADVYVADMDEPALQVRELKRPVAAGRIGIAAGGPPIRVARFSFGSGAELRSAPPPLPSVEGIVRTWDVSDPFAEDETEPFVGRAWTSLDAEPNGLADLSRVNGIRDGRNTVLARTTIRSARGHTARLDFGFSDRATVYLDGEPLYRGDDTYRSRDYRFLGSIGWWDSLYLPLRAGENELVFAVSEDFGGWGVQARLA